MLEPFPLPSVISFSFHPEMARDAGSDRELAEMAQEEVKALEASIEELEKQLKAGWCTAYHAWNGITS